MFQVTDEKPLWQNSGAGVLLRSPGRSFASGVPDCVKRSLDGGFVDAKIVDDQGVPFDVHFSAWADAHFGESFPIHGNHTFAFECVDVTVLVEARDDVTQLFRGCLNCELFWRFVFSCESFDIATRGSSNDEISPSAVRFVQNLKALSDSPACQSSSSVELKGEVFGDTFIVAVDNPLAIRDITVAHPRRHKKVHGRLVHKLFGVDFDDRRVWSSVKGVLAASGSFCLDRFCSCETSLEKFDVVAPLCLLSG